MQRFDTLLEEREVVEDAGGWWLFFLTGIAWLVFALLVFQWDYTTVYAISFLFGVVAVIAGVNELIQIMTVGVVEILLAFWVAGAFREKAILLVVYVGVIALTRGITELFLAFKLLTGNGGGGLRPASLGFRSGRPTARWSAGSSPRSKGGRSEGHQAHT